MISCCDLQLRAWQRINPNSDFQWFSCCGFAPRLSVSHLVQQLASNYAVALVWDSDSGGTACLCWSIFGQKIEPKEQLVKKCGGVFEESLPVTMYYECSIADMHKQPSVPKGLLNQNVLSQRERERQMFMRDCLEQMTMFVHTTWTPFPDLWPSGCAACCATKFYAAVMAESDTLSEERRLMWPGPSKGSLITFLCIFRR